MRNFIDLMPSDWFYNDVIELLDLNYIDGESFFTGIPYNVFTRDPVDVFIDVISPGVEFTYECSPFVPNDGVNNIVKVFLNGDEITYRSVTHNEVDKLVFILNTPASVGDVLRLKVSGIPSYVTNAWGRVIPNPNLNAVGYPFAALGIESGSHYFYSPYYGQNPETVKLKGVPLKRIEYDVTKVHSTHDLLKYDNEYTISPDGFIYIHFNLVNEELEINCNVQLDNSVLSIWKHQVNVTTQKYPDKDLLYNDRIFPEILISRAEMYVLLDKIRRVIFSRYTDFTELDNNKTTSRFLDVDTGAWYWSFLRNIEELKFENGDYVLYSLNGSSLLPNQTVSKAEVINLLMNFRKYIVTCLS